MRKIELIENLRIFANYLESCPLPDELNIEGGTSFWHLADNAYDFGKTVALLGSFQKEATESYLNANKQIGGIHFQVTAIRNNVCTPKIVGKKIIPAEPEKTIEAKPERVEDIIEWECPPSFVALGKEEAHVNI